MRKPTHLPGWTGLLLVAGLWVFSPPPALSDWQQDEFILGTYWDPCMSMNTEQNLRRIDLARKAYFNLFTGTQNCEHLFNHSPAGMNYILSLVGYDDPPIRYLVTDHRAHNQINCGAHPHVKTFDPDSAKAVTEFYKGLNDRDRSVHYGYNIGDEPRDGEIADVRRWVRHFRTEQDSLVTFINLLPRYGFKSDKKYEEYLDEILGDGSDISDPNVVCFDHYPFLRPDRNHDDYWIRDDYFYNLSVIREKAGSRPFWAVPLLTQYDSQVDPDTTLLFMAFCPIAYGAKGLIYFSYEQLPSGGTQFRSAPVVNCETVTEKYHAVQRLNRYIRDVVGPVVMRSEHLGAFHASDTPTSEPISPSQLLENSSLPLTMEIANAKALVGIFRDRSLSGTFYILIVNKNHLSTEDITISFEESEIERAFEAPTLSDYDGTNREFRRASFDIEEDSTRISYSLRLSGGEGRIIRVEAGD